MVFLLGLWSKGKMQGVFACVRNDHGRTEQDGILEGDAMVTKKHHGQSLEYWSNLSQL